MLEFNKIMAFIGTQDRDRARTFYGGTLGLRLLHEDKFALAFDVAGVMLRVTPVEKVTPTKHTVLGWEVADIDKSALALKSAGVDFHRYDGLLQDELGIWTAPGGARIAWFSDPDKNVLSLAQMR